jgi:hypothetical protein
MFARAARLFAPPYLDPWEPNVDPALRAAVGGLGAHIAARLTAEGRKGVVVHALYDAWSPSRAYPHTHGGVRILVECAGARLASPIEVTAAELSPGLGYDARRASWNQPAWPGGTAPARHRGLPVRGHLAPLEHAARNRRDWLQTFLP